jgi:hypothetical protein
MAHAYSKSNAIRTARYVTQRAVSNASALAIGVLAVQVWLTAQTGGTYSTSSPQAYTIASLFRLRLRKHMAVVSLR